MALMLIVASVLTGMIVGWWLTATIATTVRSRASTRMVREWQDRALAAEGWMRAREHAHRSPRGGDDDVPWAA